MGSNGESKPWRVRIVAPVASTDGSQTAATESSFLTLWLPAPFFSGRTAAASLSLQDFSLGEEELTQLFAFPFAIQSFCTNCVQTHAPLLPVYAPFGFCISNSSLFVCRKRTVQLEDFHCIAMLGRGHFGKVV